MNMKSNIPKQPTLGNQQDTTDQDYAIGDVVVSTRNSVIPVLFEIVEEPNASFDGYVQCRSMSRVIVYWLAISEIRTATTAELKVKHRLSETEQSLAEVS
ncbi:hypothetical protein RFH42_16345 [Acinetobacter rudis]|uniref:hypothetical protein n=1 Tax=Acinetobacter rudis TaxID=632955 RepID=UPI00280E725A|nr:hypothetical protein [Acinetobacter rudis]MDQ8954521.1 hypothetical protein [Acinetobacter rudis]